MIIKILKFAALIIAAILVALLLWWGVGLLPVPGNIRLALMVLFVIVIVIWVVTGVQRGDPW